MRSMTGFGLGEAPLDHGKLAVEIRGVNHRFLDVRVRLSRELGELSGLLEQLARERLSRGRYDVSVRVDGVCVGAPVLDRGRARVAYRSLCELRDELAPGAEVPLSLLAALPDLFVSGADHELEGLREAARLAFAAAARALEAMRNLEGEALRGDLTTRLASVRRIAVTIEQRSPEVVDTHRRRLRERAERLRAATEIDVDAGRLEQEIALFAERSDVCEEITRLGSHCAQFATLLASEEAVGRRLDFLLQEMAREANTVGAKSPDAPIAHAIVDLKAEIERMREQVQNVE
jgi:uncharacterized protein (TIGR00255 family)